MKLLSRRPPDPTSPDAPPPNYYSNRDKPASVTKARYSFTTEPNAKWVPINKSFITHTKVLLSAASVRFGLVNIAVTLRCVMQQGYRHLLLVNDEHYGQTTAMGRVEEFIISTETPLTPASERLNAAEAITLPLDFQQQRLGYLVALVGKAHGACEGDPAAAQDMPGNLAIIAEEITAVIRRYQTRYRSISIDGDRCYWIGNSPALRLLDQKISSLAKSSLPVVIRGNKGTGKIIAARALHCERHPDRVPFIESDCAGWKSGAAPDILHGLRIYARGGTLFLRNINKLSAANLQSLQRFCVIQSADATSRATQGGLDLVLTLSERDMQISPVLAQWLERNSSELRLPDLHERSDDLRDLTRFFSYEYAINHYPEFTEDAWQLLEAGSWVGNVDELKRVVQQLTAMIETSLVDAAQLEPFLSR